MERKELLIFDALKAGDKTLREIMEVTGLDIFGVADGVVELINCGKVEATGERRISKVTGRSNAVFTANGKNIIKPFELNLT